MIHSILQSVEKTTPVVPLRNTHNVGVVDFTTKIFAVYETIYYTAILYDEKVFTSICTVY